jgi:hypothetical protein
MLVSQPRVSNNRAPPTPSHTEAGVNFQWNAGQFATSQAAQPFQLPPPHQWFQHGHSRQTPPASIDCIPARYLQTRSTGAIPHEFLEHVFCLDERKKTAGYAISRRQEKPSRKSRYVSIPFNKLWKNTDLERLGNTVGGP